MNIARRLPAIASLLLLLLIVANVRGDEQKTTRRVRLQANNATVFAPDTFIIAAEGTQGVGGAGTDLTSPTEGNYCDIHLNKVSINDDGDAAVLVGKVVEASDPSNYGAFVKITAHTNGNVNFDFQPINPNGGAATIVDFTGATVTIVKVSP
jgi:hypothetical protein